MRKRKDIREDIIKKHPESTPTPEMGNFSFVEQFDAELYRKILSAEGLIKTDLVNAAKGLRDVLQMFLEPIFGANSAADAKAAQLRADPNKNYSVLGSRVSALESFPDLKIYSSNAKKVRSVGNNGAHYEEAKDKGEAFNYSIVRAGMTAMQTMMKTYYANKAASSEDAEIIRGWAYMDIYQPLNDMLVYNARVTDEDADGREEDFEAEYFCFRERNGRYQYFVVRQYPSVLLDNRDSETLDLLWNESVRNPQGIIRYSSFTSKEGSDTSSDIKTFVCYQINGRPLALTPSLISRWTPGEKIRIFTMLAEGISSMHENKIYHRNIQPSAVYAYKVNGVTGVNLVNFEFSKITGNKKTVFGNALQNYGEEFIFSAPELRSLNTDSDSSNIDWEKADIYSLGVLFAYIVMDGDFRTEQPRSIQPVLNKNKALFPEDLLKLISMMTSNTLSRRPDIGAVGRMLAVIDV